jgi:hypothetical protein
MPTTHFPRSLLHRPLQRPGYLFVPLLTVLLVGGFALWSMSTATRAHARPLFGSFSGWQLTNCDYTNFNSLNSPSSSFLVAIGEPGPSSVCFFGGGGYSGVNPNVYGAPTMYCSGPQCNGWFKGYDSDGTGVYLSFGYCDVSCSNLLKITQICTGCGSPPINIKPVKAVPAPPIPLKHMTR